MHAPEKSTAINYVFTSGHMDAIPVSGNTDRRYFAVTRARGLTAKELKRSIEECATEAVRDEPSVIDNRARRFVAMLSGRVMDADPALGALLFAVVLGHEGGKS